MGQRAELPNVRAAIKAVSQSERRKPLSTCCTNVSKTVKPEETPLPLFFAYRRAHWEHSQGIQSWEISLMVK